MSYASRSGRARTNASSPSAHAICDRCGRRWNHIDLQFQHEWRGSSLQNIKILVCRPCLDVPQEQLRAIIVPMDPVPILNARIENYSADEGAFFSLSTVTTDPTTGIPVPSSTTLATEGGVNLTAQPIGPRRGLPQQAIMPLQGTTAYAVPVGAISVTANGTNVVSVTCSSIGSLAVNSQISVSGLSADKANGLYSVASVVGNSFTYWTNSIIPAGSLLTAKSSIVTANVGLPLDYAQVPTTGPVDV